MKIHNSLTKKIEKIVPIEDKKINFYSCGPTVYNYLHIGNLSAFIYADSLTRALMILGYKVNHVMNITDVDDKTIRDSKIYFKELDSMEALSALTTKYTKIFKDDIKKIGNNVENLTFVSAVDSIPDMIEMIQKILDKNIAYIASDGIYFSISEYLNAGFNYGVFNKLDSSHSKSRISNDEYDKTSVSDFALWKKSTPEEPKWEAKFIVNGEEITIFGRPGWHIECTAMSKKLLGLPFDIHSGGIDLIFPHHENEIAQALASGSKGFSNYFIHNNHLLVDGKKMSKSLNNFYTLKDIQKRGFDPLSFRLLALSSHYSSESNFSWEILEAASTRLKRWRAIADLRFQSIQTTDIDFESILDEIKDFLGNDLNIPVVISKLETNFFEKFGEKSYVGNNQLKEFNKVLDFIDKALGLGLLQSEDISENQKKTISKRERARISKNWLESDKLRDEISSQGLNINDTEVGPIWSRA